MKIVSSSMIILFALSFSSCSQKTKIVYVKSNHPYLKTWEQNKTIPTLKIDYKQKQETRVFSLEEKDFYSWSNFTVKIKRLLIKSININNLYKKQIEEYNKKFATKEKK